MNPLTAVEISHELECAEAAFAVLIEKSTTQSKKIALIKERNTFLSKFKVKELPNVKTPHLR